MSTPEHFYDGLAPIHDLIYEDWPRSIERQGDALEALIRARCPAARAIADVAYGIGTQSLGLAARGFEVTASDISSGAVARAEREAAARGLDIRFRVDDMERLTSYGSGSADVLIACDNAVPHLLGDDRIRTAFRRFHDVLRPGGLCVISVRDYAAGGARWRAGRSLRRADPWGGPRDRASGVGVGGDEYDLDMYFIFDDGRRVDTQVFRSRYYAVSIARLVELMSEAGFADAERVDGAFFQPLVVGHKR